MFGYFLDKRKNKSVAEKHVTLEEMNSLLKMMESDLKKIDDALDASKQITAGERIGNGQHNDYCKEPNSGDNLFVNKNKCHGQ